MKLKRLIPVFLTLFLFILFFTNAKYINNSIADSIDFCLKTLIPSVFPFMLVSSFLIYSRLIDDIILKAKIPVENILGVCKIYLSSVILGSVSGYVTGPKCICAIYSSSNSNDRESFSNSVILSSNCGIGFVVSCVGIIIWDSITFGIFLYTLQILISLLLGKLLLKGNVKNYDYNISKRADFTDSFTLSVTNTASSLIGISAFVIFFSLLSDLSQLYIPKRYSGLLPIALEFCKGVFYAKEFYSVGIGAFLTGFAIGFGGLCVAFQTFSVCSGYPLDKKKYLLFKLLHGVLLGISSLLFVSINNI